MKIASIYFDDVVVIPMGKSFGTDQPRGDLRDAMSFHADEGWDIRETLPGSGCFSLCCEGMPAPVTVGGYGYSYVATHETQAVDEEVAFPKDAAPLKRRRR